MGKCCTVECIFILCSFFLFFLLVRAPLWPGDMEQLFKEQFQSNTWLTRIQAETQEKFCSFNVWTLTWKQKSCLKYTIYAVWLLHLHWFIWESVTGKDRSCFLIIMHFFPHYLDKSTLSQSLIYQASNPQKQAKF